MKVNPVKLVPTIQLRANASNPKGPLGLKYKQGLRTSLARWGFAGLFVVASNDDGTFEVLDGNTRLEELEKAGTENVPCVVFDGMGPEERKKFVLAHDRHRKNFNEDAVMAQLEQLAHNGEDLKELALLSGKDNLKKLLAEMSGQPVDMPDVPQAKVAPMASMVLYGPASEMESIKGLLKQIKGRLSTLEKSRKALADAAEFLEWGDEKTLLVLLATIAKVQLELPG